MIIYDHDSWIIWLYVQLVFSNGFPSFMDYDNPKKKHDGQDLIPYNHQPRDVHHPNLATYQAYSPRKPQNHWWNKHLSKFPRCLGSSTPRALPTCSLNRLNPPMFAGRNPESCVSFWISCSDSEDWSWRFGTQDMNGWKFQPNSVESWGFKKLYDLYVYFWKKRPPTRNYMGHGQYLVYSSKTSIFEECIILS